jgi:hypothetical protein
MQKTFITLMRWPGGENDGGNTTPKNEEIKADDLQPDSTAIPHEKGFIEKVKDALKDWSNDDQQDQQEDDATP